MIRVILPHHLRTLANSGAEVTVDVAAPRSLRALLDVLETRYPALRGTLRDYDTGARRPMLRFYACEQDLSLEPPDALLPDAVTEGREPFFIVAAIAGG